MPKVLSQILWRDWKSVFCCFSTSCCCTDGKRNVTTHWQDSVSWSERLNCWKSDWTQARPAGQQLVATLRTASVRLPSVMPHSCKRSSVHLLTCCQTVASSLKPTRITSRRSCTNCCMPSMTKPPSVPALFMIKINSRPCLWHSDIGQTELRQLFKLILFGCPTLWHCDSSICSYCVNSLCNPA